MPALYTVCDHSAAEPFHLYSHIIASFGGPPISLNPTSTVNVSVAVTVVSIASLDTKIAGPKAWTMLLIEPPKEIWDLPAFVVPVSDCTTPLGFSVEFSRYVLSCDEAPVP